MLKNALLGFSILFAVAGCEPPVDAVSIANEENREYFKSLLKNEKIPFEVMVENGEEVMRFNRADSERVRTLIYEFGGTTLQPDRAVCYKDKEILADETAKLTSANARFKLVRNYEYTCITWDERDSDKVKSVIY